MSVSEIKPAPERRVRLVSVVVQLNLVVDDGKHLAPLQVEPIGMPAAEWSNFRVESAIEDVTRQLDQRE